MASTFSFRRIASDREGYYYDRWDRATPLTVVAETEAEARTEAHKVSGEPPRGRFWKFALDTIEALPPTPVVEHWIMEVDYAEDNGGKPLPGLIGPFPSREAAEALGNEVIKTGEWGVAPLHSPESVRATYQGKPSDG